MKISAGDRVYTTGDMANPEQFGTVEASDGAALTVAWDDGSRSTLSPHHFSEEFLGHCGTRFVTEAAYRRWRAEQERRLLGTMGVRP